MGVVDDVREAAPSIELVIVDDTTVPSKGLIHKLGSAEEQPPNDDDDDDDDNDNDDDDDDVTCIETVVTSIVKTLETY